MIVELGCIVVGVPVGYALRHVAGIEPVLDTVLTWTVRVLLFLLGLALGADEGLMAELETLGLRATVVSLCAVAGSLVAARILGKILPLGEGTSKLTSGQAGGTARDDV